MDNEERSALVAEIADLRAQVEALQGKLNWATTRQCYLDMRAAQERESVALAKVFDLTVANDALRVSYGTLASRLSDCLVRAEKADAKARELDAENAALSKDQQDWRKGITLIANNLGETKPPDLCCVRIARKALDVRAQNERLTTENAALAAARPCSIVACSSRRIDTAKEKQ